MVDYSTRNTRFTVQLLIMYVILLRASAFRISQILLPRHGHSLSAIASYSSRRSARVSLFSSSNDIDDAKYMMEAVKYAERGLGRTFPNPAVGCVLVDQKTGNVIGSGFHPRAGFPHAEVFALFEAAGHVNSGVDAAQSVVETEGNPERKIMELTKKYASDGGPEDLFDECLAKIPITAYVTLEPCCHYGQTPPCAASLALAKVNRVVVGFRDPNPRVDGGGVKLLEGVGVQVDLVNDRESKKSCKSLVTNFVKRITPRPELGEDYEYVTGKMRRTIRAVAGRKMQEKTLPSVDWGGNSSVEVDDDMEDAIMDLPLKPEWMEHVDALLWTHEIIQVKLNKAVAKKKGAKLLGERIAMALNAHVAQTKGHGVLLYRPGIPPSLDFNES